MKLFYEWEELPIELKTEEVKPYWESLRTKKAQLLIKRLFDIFMASLLIILLAIPMGVIAVLIKLDSPGPIFYRQVRVTSFGKRFRIHKFRTMVDHADTIGTSVTVDHDTRITKIGSKIRNLRIDEFPQVFDILLGDMSFVGTRPEAVRYVERYKPEYFATLLLPAGVTSEAAIRFKDEAKFLSADQSADDVYIEKVLPEKMKWNLESVYHFGLLRDFVTLLRTVFSFLGKEYH